MQVNTDNMHFWLDRAERGLYFSSDDSSARPPCGVFDASDSGPEGRHYRPWENCRKRRFPITMTTNGMTITVGISLLPSLALFKGIDFVQVWPQLSTSPVSFTARRQLAWGTNFSRGKPWDEWLRGLIV